MTAVDCMGEAAMRARTLNAHLWCARTSHDAHLWYARMSHDTHLRYARMSHDTHLRYARMSPSRTLFEVKQGAVSRGANVAFLSQYAAEAEVLFPPLTAFDVMSTRIERCSHEAVMM